MEGGAHNVEGALFYPLFDHRETGLGEVAAPTLPVPWQPQGQDGSDLNRLIQPFIHGKGAWWRLRPHLLHPHPKSPLFSALCYLTSCGLFG